MTEAGAVAPRVAPQVAPEAVSGISPPQGSLDISFLVGVGVVGLCYKRAVLELTSSGVTSHSDAGTTGLADAVG